MATIEERLGLTPVGGITRGGIIANPISGGPISDEAAGFGLPPIGGYDDIRAAALGVTPPGGVVEAFGGELGRGLVRGFFNVGGGLVGTAEYLIPGKQESLIEAKRKIELAKADYSQEYGNWAGWAGRILGEAFPYMGAALVGGYVGAGIGSATAIGAKAGALAGAASVGFSVEGQNAYDDAISTGATEDEANTERLLVGTINAAIETAQITKIMRFHKAGAGSLRSFIRNARNRAWDLMRGDAKQFGGQVLKHALEEGLEEAAQEGVSIGIPAALRGQVPRKPNGMVDWSQILNRIGASGAAGGFAGGVLGAGGALIGAAPEVGRPSNKEIDKAISAVEGYNIPAKEKELWKAQLNEYRIELGEEREVAETVSVGEDFVQMPEGVLTSQELADDIKTQAETIGTTPEAIIGDIRLEAQAEKIISRFPQKIKDQTSLASIGEAIKNHMGLGDWDIEWQFINKGRAFGWAKRTGDKKAVIQIKGATGELYFFHYDKPTKGLAGGAPRKKGQAYRQTQAEVKRTIVHELGHLARPAYYNRETGRMHIHTPEFAAWVKDNVKQLFATRPTGFKPVSEVGIPQTIGGLSEVDMSQPAWQTSTTLGFETKPQPPINVYKTVSGSRRGITEQEVVREGERYVDSQTGEDVVLDTEASTGALAKSDIPALNREWDTHLTQSVQSIDVSFRAEHRTAIKKAKGQRVAAAEKILGDESIDPAIRANMARRHLAGELGLRFEQLKFDENQISYYHQRVLTAPLDTFEKLNATAGLDALFIPNENGQIKLPMPHQIAALEEVFGPEFAKALHNLRAETHTLGKKIIDAMNLPRAVLASFDMSAAGRQGLMLLPIAPKQWLKAVGRGYRAWTSPEYAKYNELQIKSDPFFKTYKSSGGFLSEMGSVLKGEEVFISELAHRIPGIPASERAYVTTLNALRFYTFKKYAQQWQGTGKSHEDYVLLAKFINHTTGRGSVKGLEEYMPALNALFFAPRLTMGRIQALGDLFRGATGDVKAGKFSPTRKIIAQDLILFFVGGAGILGLLSLMKGVDVEDDPRSSDFGKIRFGNTRIDFWGGYSQIARLTARLISAEAKGTETGRIMPTDRGQVVWRFVQSKLSPASGMSVDLIRGETFIGEQLEATPEGITKQAFERFTPLFIQDVVDSARYQGLTTAMVVAPLAGHGIGAMTYPVRPATEASRIKDVKSREAYGMGWDEVGPLAQSYIRERNPDIELLERQARSERENFDMVARRLEEQHKVTQDIIKKLPVPIRNDIDRLDVVIPGLSRYVSNGWYLNDKRYKVYQNEIRKGLTQYLSRLRSRPMWSRMSNQMKAVLIEDVAKMVRDQVRTKLLVESQIEDFRRLQ